MTQAFPLSFKDVISLQELVYNLRSWCYQLGPELKVELDRIITEVNAELEMQFNNIEGEKVKWELLFTEFMANIDERLQALNDLAMSNLIKTPSSLTRIELDKLYATKAALTLISNTVSSLETSKADKGQHFVNVADFGAVGNGTTDDTASITAASASLGTGAAILHFPAKSYVVNNIKLRSNTVYEGNGATLLPTSYNAFRGLSGSVKGYGAGGKNIVISGFTFKGDFTAFDKAAAITIHHGENITIENCIFDEAVLGGHAIDLSGCSNVTIRDCEFIGFNPPSGREYAECIQIDHSTASGVSNQDASTSYDGLPCQDIRIVNNKFLPKTVGGVSYYAPNPFGAHATLAVNHKRIMFEGNIVINPFPSRSLNAIVAPIHFQGVEDLHILNNYFGGHGEPTSLIKLISYSTGIGAGDISNPTPGPGVNVGVRSSRNIFIEGNTFDGFDSLENKGLISVRGADLGALSPENISVSRNVFKNLLPTGVRGNTGSNPIAFLYCKNVRVNDNNVDRARSLVYANSVDDILVSGNIINDTEWVTVHLEGTENERARGAMVSGNSLDRVGTAVYASRTDSVVITGNAVMRTKDGASLAGYANGNITVADCDTSSVTANSIHGINPPNTSGPIQFLNGVVRGAGVGNTSLGWTNTVYADGSSSAKNVGNVTI